jgi:hypothetical protein
MFYLNPLKPENEKVINDSRRVGKKKVMGVRDALFLRGERPSYF